ncbi:MAG: YtxH domain-containing protein [Tenericutes bacterium]|nr:YtxH domain-containing protein [Mycoplasmatota bacterium]
MSKKSGLGKFILGAGVGAGLALLFAPQEGSKTRKELKIKLDELLDKAKQIDVDDVKADIIQRVEELRTGVKDLDKEKALEIAKSQAKKIEKKANELYEVAKEKSAPVIEKAAKEVKETALKAAKEVVNKLEEETEEKPKKTAKKQVKKNSSK